MSTKNLQFSVAVHVMAVLAYFSGRELTSQFIAGSVNADASFVRRTIAKLSKAGLIVATRGKFGACSLARKPEEISLLDIYLASDAPPTFAIHGYEVQPRCPVSRNIKGYMGMISLEAQQSFQAQIAKSNLKEFLDGLSKLEKNKLQKL